MKRNIECGPSALLYLIPHFQLFRFTRALKPMLMLSTPSYETEEILTIGQQRNARLFISARYIKDCIQQPPCSRSMLAMKTSPRTRAIFSRVTLTGHMTGIDADMFVENGAMRFDQRV